MSKKWFINMRNLVILFAGAVFTSIFYIWHEDITKPIVFTIVLLALSMLHPILFDNRVNVQDKTERQIYSNQRLSEINNLVDRINKSIRYIKSRTEDNARLDIVTRFMNEIDEFEDSIPDLMEDYKRGLGFVKKNNMITKEILNLEKKITIVKGVARDTYMKALNEKRSTLHEILKIKTYLEESESKLHYIFSILQKIEAIVESTEFEQELSDEDLNNLNTNLETFSGSLKGIIRSMKL